MTKQGTKTKGMCIATRCTSVEQFIQMFHRFVDEESFFISTVNTRPPGLETSFSVQLADGTPVLRGLCVVLQSWTTPANPFKTPGVRLGIKRLTANSMTVFEKLLVSRSTSKPPPSPAAALAAGTVMPIAKTPFSETAPTKISPSRVELAAPARVNSVVAELATGATTDVLPVAPSTTTETRTPGSELVLPANPLMNLTDESLEGYVDCTLYEETGNFFPVDEDPEILVDDVLAPPPSLLSPRPAVKRISEPIAAQPPPARFDTSPVTTISAPRFETGPAPVVPAPPVVAPVAEPPAVPARDSDNAFAQRDSTPTFGENATVVPLPPVRKRSPMWMIGALVLLAGAAGAVVFTAKSSDGGNAATPAKPAVARDVVPDPVKPEPVETEKPIVEPEENKDPPSTDGPPVVGDGPCKLAVNTTPAGSTIQLDGKTLAPSPITIAASCDKHQITVSHARYQSATKLVTLNADKQGSLEVTLNRPTHMVTVNSSPSGATVFIDGRRAGTTPTKLNVLGFVTVRLEIKKTGYQTATEKLYSKVPDDKVSVRLAKW